jgi:thioredoxin reductase (NADPH)
MFPELSPEEIGRLRRFGEIRGYAVGEPLLVTGESSPGMFVIISGTVAVKRRNLWATSRQSWNGGLAIS